MVAKIQPLASLKKEMLAVARGERTAPADAAQVSYESAHAILGLLTPENRQLLALIDQRKPESVAALAQLVGRAEPNVSRTLHRLAACGFVRLIPGRGKAKVPQVLIRRVMVDIDVFAQSDLVTLI